MGWKQGDGLGKNQDGRTEHLDVKLKTNSKGLGFIRGKYDSTWIEHSNSFDQVLQQLQLSHSTSTSTSKDISNLRENLQQTKTRFKFNLIFFLFRSEKRKLFICLVIKNNRVEKI